MTHREALEILTVHRDRKVVITTHGSVDLWMELSNSPLDLAYVPTSMGQAPNLGLGLALAQPERGVVVINGDGAMLMNLGSLVTIAACPADLFLVIIENGVYEVTGGQAVAGAGRTDFGGLSRAAGIGRVYSYESAAAWRKGAAEALSGWGPAVICLKVIARPGQRAPTRALPIEQQIARLTHALGVPDPRVDQQPGANSSC
jgi:thiamine pyrophosphate-dependent acetolactate synthase large subunit-like protein